MTVRPAQSAPAPARCGRRAECPRSAAAWRRGPAGTFAGLKCARSMLRGTTLTRSGGMRCALHHRPCVEQRMRDQPVAAAERAEIERGEPHPPPRQIGQVGDQMDAVAFGGDRCAPGRARALGVDDGDALGRDELVERLGIGAKLRQIHGRVGERQPLAAEACEFVHQLAALAGDDDAGADLHQGARGADRGAHLRRVVERRHDLQYRRARKRAGQHALLGGIGGHRHRFKSSPFTPAHRPHPLALGGGLRRNTGETPGRGREGVMT